ncbi:uncharacterized protein N7484_005864 [Penicillium longicatenatum]|uniref:uncharacterized protein n=1 Tax=Penicillium longicatenatum TaxID=1561947 RepID=UPI002546EE6F|nr:uncharacterized protein N7484_005864 [Penicillium longicatenatum]KAJ5643357.1 hypothetical protein N7484_005864 [Penicillium longicatenatum]
MAYDGYQSPPNSGYQGMGNMNTDPNDNHGYTPTPPYPSYYESDHITMPQPQMPPASSAPPPQSYEYPEPSRPGNSNSGHINDAVSSAVYNNANSNSYLSPEVLSQITSTVIQQLKASGMSDIQGSPQNTQSQYPPPPPPRPQSQSQAQQQPWMAPPTDLPLRPQSESPSAPLHQRSGSIPPPSAMPNNFEVPQSQPYSGYSSDTRSNSKTSPDPTPRRTGSMSSQGSVRAEARPKPPDRDATVMEMTTLEKVWGKLFEDDKPTPRLGQFLRGIAMHLIEDYPPGNTLVIIPQKLQKFYADTNVSPDAYPWQDIFDDNTSSISRLFREVKAQHHLVQKDDLSERPDIPGLTPKGFETWATLMILAHPDREYERLQKAVLNMPISNPDDKKERFPKEIPRRLFPEFADLKLREATELHIMKHCGVDLPRITDEERSKASRPKASPPLGSGRSSGLSSPRNASTERSRSYERGRPPPSASSSTAILDDEDETIPPAPIERERKPYSANPGGGKVYDEVGNPRTHRDSFTRPSDIPPASTSSHRVSTIPRSPTRDSLYAQRSGSGPAPYHRHSKGHSRTSRSSSRSIDGYRHSESDLLGRDHTPRYGNVSTNDLYMEPTAMSPDADDARYHGSHRNSRTDEDYYRGLLGGQGGGPKYY